MVDSRNYFVNAQTTRKPNELKVRTENFKTHGVLKIKKIVIFVRNVRRGFIQYLEDLIYPLWTTGCKQMRKDKEYLNFFQSFSSDPLRLGDHTRAIKGKKHERLREVFSYHRAYDSCSKEEYFLYIEPLVSFLRHPGAVCFSNDPQDKSYIMLPSASSIISKGAKKYFFDVGASTYIAGLGGDSQKWFIDNYRLQGIEFDHIFGWEAKPTRPSEQWNSVPPDIKRKTSWYNIPA